MSFEALNDSNKLFLRQAICFKGGALGESQQESVSSIEEDKDRRGT
jgi:hypothetical protein